MLPLVRARLLVADAWEGLSVEEPGRTHGYQRLVCREALEWQDRVLVVGVHHFRGQGRGRMHDHRWPLAAWPFTIGSEDRRAPLYDMPWESVREGAIVASGLLTVRHGEAWAIEEHTAVRHAVWSHREHGSINVTDMTHPPTRENRLEVARLDEDATDRIRRRLLPWAHDADAPRPDGPR